MVYIMGWMIFVSGFSAGWLGVLIGTFVLTSVHSPLIGLGMLYRWQSGDPDRMLLLSHRISLIVLFALTLFPLPLWDSGLSLEDLLFMWPYVAVLPLGTLILIALAYRKLDSSMIVY